MRFFGATRPEVKNQPFRQNWRIWRSKRAVLTFHGACRYLSPLRFLARLVLAPVKKLMDANANRVQHTRARGSATERKKS